MVLAGQFFKGGRLFRIAKSLKKCPGCEIGFLIRNAVQSYQQTQARLIRISIEIFGKCVFRCKSGLLK